VSIEIVVDAHAELGEGPVWLEDEQRLVWLDILAGGLHRLDPTTADDRVLVLDGPVCAAAPRRAGGLVLALEHEIAVLDTGAERPEPVAVVLDADSGERFNDGACDPAGRLWTGTLRYDGAPHRASLWCVTPEGRVERALAGLSLSNGLAWAPDGCTLWHIDTPTRGIDAYEADPATGRLGRRRRLVEIEPGAGDPDGMALDADGCLWVALWDGAAVHRYTPDGRRDRRIELPVSRPTSCAFGGRDRTTLFVTSARYGLDDQRLGAEPHAGAVFALDAGVAGTPEPGWAG
jgi:sugar lactone lactonase YvrE